MAFTIKNLSRAEMCAVSLLFSGDMYGAAAADTGYPLTINSCGRDITFKKAPARAVSLGQSSTETLYLLGLSDKVVGTAVRLGPVLKGYEDANAKVARPADNVRASRASSPNPHDDRFSDCLDEIRRVTIALAVRMFGCSQQAGFCSRSPRTAPSHSRS